MKQQIQQLRDLKISGTASTSGGIFNRVYIKGEGEIEGDIECNSLKVVGVINVHGHLKTKQMKIMGTSEVTGNCNADQIKIMGDVVIKGDCNAESFKSSGGFTIDGLLNAGTIEVKLYGPARAREMGGDTIHVKLPFRIFSGYKSLTVDVVEGDDIRLENTKAKVVRGNKVYIGPGCEIDLVEYKGDFQQVKKAKVTEAKKI